MHFTQNGLKRAEKSATDRRLSQHQSGPVHGGRVVLHVGASTQHQQLPRGERDGGENTHLDRHVPNVNPGVAMGTVGLDVRGTLSRSAFPANRHQSLPEYGQTAEVKGHVREATPHGSDRLGATAESVQRRPGDGEAFLLAAGHVPVPRWQADFIK